ncbi:hypothetical protein [Streptomyces sp. NBC_00286]|uniref:hypothetical protein n=1 Tax=Streptomyces sp. NBC_00286 TaxID=2975701 RepID=UPI002E2D177F|nr:hypothetical protein [Streptomyces sp. NBC_00286]
MPHSHTVAGPQRGAPRWRTQRRLPKPFHLVLRFLLVTLIATGALVTTTGSASAQDEPNGALSQRPTPGVVYRGDSRHPNDIFANGFTARGTNYDLRNHVHGGHGSNDSGYISTSGTRDVAVPFARSQGQITLANQAAEPRCQGPGWTIGESIPVVGWLVMSHCIHSTHEVRTFVYTIDPRFVTGVPLYVPDQLRGDPAMYEHYRSQDEWAFFHRIPPQAITGVQIYRLTGRAVNGRLEMQSVTFDEERWVPNPNYVPNYRYDPIADPTADLDLDQDLNIPALPANDYNRGCSAAQQCRG